MEFNKWNRDYTKNHPTEFRFENEKKNVLKWMRNNCEYGINIKLFATTSRTEL